jgi:hypothetical protein
MEAHIFRIGLVATILSSFGASYRSANFVVTAPSPEMAEQIGKTAEKYRKELAQEWLGHELRTWAQPCPIVAHVAPNLGAGGATSFLFEQGEVFGWRMTIQGSQERILDSVLPHEVTHTIFATHFRQPLPRWADEGACTTVEHTSERAKQQVMLIDFLRNGRGIAFTKMFGMKEYPHDVMPLYSQGYSLARYLISQRGKQEFLSYLSDGLRDENWARATQQHYGFPNLGALQNAWLQWVRQGSPPIDTSKLAASTPKDTQIQSAARTRPEPNLIYRGQSPDTTLARVAAAEQPNSQPPQVETQTEGGAGWRARATGAAASREDNSGATDALPGAPHPAAADVETASSTQDRKPHQVILEWSRDGQGDQTHVAASGNDGPSVYQQALSN